MTDSFIDRETLNAFLARLDAAFARPGRLYLIGETTQVYEGWRRWTTRAELTADVAEEDRAAFDDALARAAGGLEVYDESPADLIPLPDGYAERARPAAAEGLDHLEVYHFDPYSVAFRFIARGDEPDYHLVLLYLERGWITMAAMEDHLERLLPRFSLETIQQDPAEFRRKYKGLKQMAQAIRPNSIHRHSPA
jgi:hypothetical protein